MCDGIGLLDDTDDTAAIMHFGSIIQAVSFGSSEITPGKYTIFTKRNIET